VSDTSDLDEAIKKAYRLLEVRERSCHELSERLVRAGFAEDIVTLVLSHCKEYGFQDDLRYASLFIRGKLSAGWGERRIERELHRQGIELSEVPGYPHEFKDMTELDRAIEFLAKHPIPSKNGREKLYRKLVTRGYSGETAYSAVRIYLDKASR
jgi:regulatory protein